MNPQDHDHPDFTAYALGELSPADAERVRQRLAESPEARAVFARIEQTIGALQTAPALPKRALHPRQRETVLAMGQGPASVARPAKKVVPFRGFWRPAGSETRPSAAWRAVKYAAAACLVFGAYMVGQKTTSRISPLVVSQDPPMAQMPETTPPVVKPAVDPMAVQIAEFIAVSKPEASPPTRAPKSEVALLPKATTPATPPVAVAEAKAKPATAPAPQPAAAKPAPVFAEAKTSANAMVPRKGFYDPSDAPEAELTIDPKLIRPLPVPHEFAGVILASPLPLDAKPAATPRKAESQPALVIHWGKPEIASCPWDASRRLVRFVAQVPVAQPGIENSDADYKLTAKFDPFQVQGYRLVMDKYMRPVAGATQAHRFAWYEIIPTRNFNPSADKPVTIGTISVEQPRGAASDIAPLKFVDRGLAWSDASEVFVFETAMLGWNLLLNGTENIGGLNSNLVLDLAEKTRGEDAKSERTKFINAVKQAQKAVGM